MSHLRTRSIHRLEKKVNGCWQVVFERDNVVHLQQQAAILRAQHPDRHYRIILVSMLINEVVEGGAA